MEVRGKKQVQDLLKSKSPIVIFFYLDGCGHCEAMKQPYSEIQKETPSMKFYRVESANVPDELGITGFPEFRRIQDGKQVMSASGEMTKDELKKKLLGGARRKSAGNRSARRGRHTRRLTRRRR